MTRDKLLTQLETLKGDLRTLEAKPPAKHNKFKRAELLSKIQWTARKICQGDDRTVTPLSYKREYN